MLKVSKMSSQNGKSFCPTSRDITVLGDGNVKLNESLFLDFSVV